MFDEYLNQFNASKQIRFFTNPSIDLLNHLKEKSVRSLYFEEKDAFLSLWSYYESKSTHCDRMKITKVIHREYLNKSNCSSNEIILQYDSALYNGYKFSYDTLSTIQTMYTSLLKGLKIKYISKQYRLNALKSFITCEQKQVLYEYVENIHKVGNFALVPFYMEGKSFNNAKGSCTGKFRDLIGLSLKYLSDNEEELKSNIGMTYNEYIDIMKLEKFQDLIEIEESVLNFIKKPNANNSIIFEYMKILNSLILERNELILNEIIQIYEKEENYNI